MSKNTKAKKDAARKERIRQEKHQARTSVKGLNISGKITPEMFPDDQYLFWLAHGVNYLVSNYEQGLWEPLFPDIYEGKTVTTDEMAQAIVKKFSAGPPEWSKAGKAALAWSIISRDIAYIYYLEAIRRLKARDPKCNIEELIKQPGNPTVWQVFNYMLDNMGKTKKMIRGTK